MEALSLHESVPGHHLQISLAQELENEPEFRKHVGYSAFVEGWALYCEGLGEELGMYKDPYSKFGQLSYEMWRAVRLVVDTGMHAQDWTRDQAIQFFKDNTGKTDQDITVEVDRYIVWPGQALAYKLGQLKIRELRTQAEKRQGATFNLRAFHDAVLENGAVPLNVLSARMEDRMAVATK
jgi:prolyl oligopeptidase